MSQLVSQSRFKDTFKDIFLTQIEFLEVVNLMDNSFCNFERKKSMAKNRKYSLVVSNLVEDYLNEQVKLNEKYIHNISRIQKKFLDSESSKSFLEDFFIQVEDLSTKIQNLKEESNEVRPDEKNDFYDRIQNTIAKFFPLSAQNSSNKKSSKKILEKKERTTPKQEKQHSFGGLPQNLNIAPAKPASMNTMGDRKMSTGRFNTVDERQEPPRHSANYTLGQQQSEEIIHTVFEESHVVHREVRTGREKAFSYQDFKTPSRNIENMDPNIMGVDGSRRRNWKKMSYCNGLNKSKSGLNNGKNYASLARSLHASRSPTLDPDSRAPIFDSQVHHLAANLEENGNQPQIMQRIPQLPEARREEDKFNSPQNKPFSTKKKSPRKERKSKRMVPVGDIGSSERNSEAKVIEPLLEEKELSRQVKMTSTKKITEIEMVTGKKKEKTEKIEIKKTMRLNNSHPNNDTGSRFAHNQKARGFNSGTGGTFRQIEFNDIRSVRRDLNGNPAFKNGLKFNNSRNNSKSKNNEGNEETENRKKPDLKPPASPEPKRKYSGIKENNQRKNCENEKKIQELNEDFSSPIQEYRTSVQRRQIETQSYNELELSSERQKKNSVRENIQNVHSFKKRNSNERFQEEEVEVYNNKENEVENDHVFNLNNFNKNENHQEIQKPNFRPENFPPPRPPQNQNMQYPPNFDNQNQRLSITNQNYPYYQNFPNHPPQMVNFNEDRLGSESDYHLYEAPPQQDAAHMYNNRENFNFQKGPHLPPQNEQMMMQNHHLPHPQVPHPGYRDFDVENHGNSQRHSQSRRKHRKSLSVVSVKSDRSYLSKNLKYSKQETIKFLKNMEAKETFQTPHQQGNFFLNLIFKIAISISVITKYSGLIGYEIEGLKKYEIQEEELVKIISLKEGKKIFLLIIFQLEISPMCFITTSSITHLLITLTSNYFIS